MQGIDVVSECLLVSFTQLCVDLVVVRLLSGVSNSKKPVSIAITDSQAANAAHNSDYTESSSLSSTS